MEKEYNKFKYFYLKKCQLKNVLIFFARWVFYWVSSTGPVYSNHPANIRDRVSVLHSSTVVSDGITTRFLPFDNGSGPRFNDRPPPSHPHTAFRLLSAENTSPPPPENGTRKEPGGILANEIYSKTVGAGTTFERPYR